MTTTKIFRGITVLGLALGFCSLGLDSEASAAPRKSCSTAQARPARKTVSAGQRKIAPTQALVFRSTLVDQTPQLLVLRQLDVIVLQRLHAIPSQAVVQCGNVCAPEHRIAGMIPHMGQREALRGWVRAGGDWRTAIAEVIQEKSGS